MPYALQTRGIFVDNSGNVGIGPSLGLPQAKLQVNGDLKVKGDVTADGAYVGSFPRPAYDSGWVAISPDAIVTLTHNLGGDADNYVVDLTFRTSGGIRHRVYYGGMQDKEGGNWGAALCEFTNTQVKVLRCREDPNVAQFRVRIWIYK